MPKHTVTKTTIRKLADAGRAVLDGLAGVLLPQPRPQHRPIPIRVTAPPRR